jgi:hypothetical protein
MTEKRELGGHLSGITYGKQMRPIFCCIYGPDGVGKTTFASQAPDVVFMEIERGTSQLDIARLPRPESLAQFRQQLLALRNAEHPFRTLCIDSLDFLEQLIWAEVCQEADIKSIELYAGGFGKGFIRAGEGYWRPLMADLVELSQKMHIVLICHSKVKRFDDPTQANGYERFQLSLNDIAGAIVRQSVDAVLFANFKTKVRELSKTNTRGLGGEERALFTEYRPSHDAKNRFNLPYEIPLKWSEFALRVREFYTGKPIAEPKPQAAVPEPLPEPPIGNDGEIPREPTGLTEEQNAALIGTMS